MAPIPDPPVNKETLDFIFDHIKDAPSEQNQIWNGLDNKVVSIFGVGSAVIGLAGFTVTRQPSMAVAVAVLLGCALVTYGAATIAALIHLWPKGARYASYGDTLWPEAWDKSVLVIKHGLVTDITAASKENGQALNKKATTLRIVVAAVGFETLFVGSAFLTHLLGG